MEQEHDNKNSYDQILKYTGIFGGVQGLNILMSLVRNKIVAVLLGPGGMGLTSLFNTAVSLLSQATNFGLSFGGIRFVSELYDHGSEEQLRHYIKVIRGWGLLTALLGVFVCVAAGPLLNKGSFSWGNHTLHFIFLAPTVGMMAITGAETAILKGTRRLKPLAMVQLLTVFVSILVSVPIFYYFRQSGIVPVITLIAFATMFFTLRYSCSIYPYRLRGARGILGEGMGMIRLGVAFILVGILNSGAEMFIRSYLNVMGDLDDVGYYNTCYMLAITYAGMVFTSMESDYYPRLSAVYTQQHLVNDIVNRQIEVCVLLISPMLAVLIATLPLLIPLLFSSHFLPVVGMAQVAVLAMYAKAMSLPISYQTLAKGDSVGFFLMDACYDVVLISLVICGYRFWGLWGTGVALALAHVVELLMVYAYTYFRFGYRISPAVLQYSAAQMSLGLCVYMVTFVSSVVLYCLLSLFFTSFSLMVSISILRRKTSLWNALQRKMRERFG